mgnify:CR=1 FL=1
MAGLPASALAAPVLNPDNSHFYEVVKADAISWEDAEAWAASMSHNGVAGHLATLTSRAEDEFVDALRAEAVANGQLTQAQVWVGGFQAPNSNEPGEGWQWLNDEGPFPGIDCFPDDGCTDAYADWADTEPNNAGGNESGLTLGRYGAGGGWNDEGSAQGSIGGFVVEYGNTATATDCYELDDGQSEADGGCNPSGSALLQLDNDSQLQDEYRVTHGYVVPDAEFACDQNPLLYRDTRVDPVSGHVIARRSLDVFGELGGGPAGALVLDADTYGNRCFGVLKSETNFSLLDSLPNGGVATVTQYPDPLLGSIPPLTCDNPDLQWRAQATYQTDDRFRMIGDAAAAITNYCNSPSRKSTPEFSFYVLNTREDCGLDIGVDGAAAVEECFNSFAVDVFDEVYDLILESAPYLVRPKRSDLTKLANQARSQIKVGHYDKATTRLEKLLREVESATWNLDPGGVNYPGYLIMYLENLLFRIEQLAEVTGS